MLQTLIHTVEQRLLHISAARQAMLMEGEALRVPLSAPWIERSWQRCLDSGHSPRERLAFDGLPHRRCSGCKSPTKAWFKPPAQSWSDWGKPSPTPVTLPS